MLFVVSVFDSVGSLFVSCVVDSSVGISRVGCSKGIEKDKDIDDTDITDTDDTNVEDTDIADAIVQAPDTAG